MRPSPVINPPSSTCTRSDRNALHTFLRPLARQEARFSPEPLQASSLATPQRHDTTESSFQKDKESSYPMMFTSPILDQKGSLALSLLPLHRRHPRIPTPSHLPLF